MVAKVISGKDIQGALNYNEHKVLEGKAECIMGNLFKDEVGKLTFYDKLNRFTDLNNRNKRTKTNTLHISLNFDATERLKVSELNAIATTYMNRIGFGDQPYLVYEHKDAAHQHVHIVTTIIKKDGKRIPIHYLGKNESEKARKEIEKEFNLVVAEKQNKSNDVVIQPVNIEKAIYGKSLTKKAISNVVNAVTRSYKYTSLPELNAVLRQFNVVADRGNEQSKMFEKKGLLYSMVNEKGERVGIPIKASSIWGKPMLSYLEKQFKLNEVLRQPQNEKLKVLIDKALRDNSISTREKLIKVLLKNNVHTILRTNPQGRTYGITFIDNTNRTVFNGSDLGKAYSASAIMERLTMNEDAVKPFRPGFSRVDPITDDHTSTSSGDSLLQQLIQSEHTLSANPDAALRLGRRKKRRKGLRL
ncbi:relaxase/mobilization nuclease domain-containing protein [Chryseolinea soli]|uniref:Relaxase n=1 Tax=Chryseolinea soli TaxID=2321403 RepID=A0A385SR33_9BACT|nr:relaxase/mobilization nuclease domain-containing protein [Chryseolinea soli]AYB32010.1 relaxase [Chryseolinea soli]